MREWTPVVCYWCDIFRRLREDCQVRSLTRQRGGGREVWRSRKGKGRWWWCSCPPPLLTLPDTTTQPFPQVISTSGRVRRRGGGCCSADVEKELLGEICHPSEIDFILRGSPFSSKLTLPLSFLYSPPTLPPSFPLHK